MDDSVRPFVRIHRTASLAVTPQLCLRRPILFCLARKEWGEKRHWMRIGLYRKPQNKPVEEHCGRHTKNCLRIWTTRRLRGDNAPIGNSFHAGRRQNTLPLKQQYIYVCADGAESLRSIVNLYRGRCPHRPVREPTNSPQIFVKTVRTARADVGIGPYKPVSNIRTISYRESIGLAPVRASNKTRARQRAI